MSERRWGETTQSCDHDSQWCGCKTDAEVLAEMGTEALMKELQVREVLWRAYWCDTHKQPADSELDETCELIDGAPALWFGPEEDDDG